LLARVGPAIAHLDANIARFDALRPEGEPVVAHPASEPLGTTGDDQRWILGEVSADDAMRPTKRKELFGRAETDPVFSPAQTSAASPFFQATYLKSV